MSTLDANSAKEALRQVDDPVLGHDIVSYRILNSVEVKGGKATVSLDIPSHAYPGPERRELEKRVTEALEKAGASGVEVVAKVNTAWQPPPSDKAILGGVRNIIAVAAGKGGVGKSTVAVNLALALKAHGAKVGLLDADVFGPSMPTMLGQASRPAGTTPDEKITPAEHHGLKVISVGFFVEPGEAVVWRGPMVHRLLQQFLGEVEWGDLDYLVCDLPPGTGDVQLSLSQLIPITGSVLVTTPQEVSLVDVVKGAAMFKKVEIPIIGVVENMSGFECPKCGHHEDIFSKGGGRRLASEIGVEFLGELPIDTRVRFAGDTGVPLVVSSPDSAHTGMFMSLATNVAMRIADSVLSKPKRSPRLSVIR